jgi:hypothetical protein
LARKTEVVEVAEVVVGIRGVVHQLLRHAANVHLQKNAESPFPDFFTGKSWWQDVSYFKKMPNVVKKSPEM